jgi:SAM-dependent methyltransferase
VTARTTGPVPPPTPYDASRAADYWDGPRHEGADELAAVLSRGEPTHVNAAYDAWEAGVLGDALLEVQGPRPSGRGLDLACGVGRISVRLSPRVSRLACGDLAAGMLRRLRRNAASSHVTNLDPLRLRSDRLPFRDGAFTLAVCLGLLEHLPPDVRRATIAELARVLAPGGLLGLVLNNDESRFLKDPADNPHRVAAQSDNGYYCAVVKQGELLAEAGADFGERTLGSNLFYSLQRHASRALAEDRRRDPRLSPFFERAALWDRALRPAGAMADAAADHHLHLLVRR